MPVGARPALPGEVLSQEDLQIFLLLGQSNMEGFAFAYDNATTAQRNFPTIEFLLSGTPAALDYRARMPFEFEHSLDSDWLEPRRDAWCLHYRSINGELQLVRPTREPTPILSGILPLSPGFGAMTDFGTMFGPELGMGRRLAEASEAPIFLFKSSDGGTTLGFDWRSPAAVAARGGQVGVHFEQTMIRFIELLDGFDLDLADDGRLNDYDAAGYTVAGVFWFQGYSEQFDDGPYSAMDLQAEYADNLRDLIDSIRAADARIPADLGLVIGESSDQDPGINASRLAAVAALNAEIPDSAAFFETDDMLNVSWGEGPSGIPFSQDSALHFHSRAENYLEIGWRAAGAILESGFLRCPDAEGSR